MANVKITGLTALGGDVDSADLFEVTDVTTTVSRKATGAEVVNASLIAGAGDITFNSTNLNTGQPVFLATNSVNDTNVTGSTLTATVEFDNEVFDQGADFNDTSDTFTAPVTGKYQLNTRVRVIGVASASDVIVGLITSNRSYFALEIAAGATNDYTDLSFQISEIVDMDSSDTATVTVDVNGMADDTAGIGGTQGITTFSGILVA